MICCKDPNYVGVYINTPKIIFGIRIYILHRWTVASFGCILLRYLNSVASKFAICVKHFVVRRQLIGSIWAIVLFIHLHPIILFVHSTVK